MARRVINIVNFIRGEEPRFEVEADFLFQPVREQMALLKHARMPATWLLQYDALVAGPYVPFLLEQAPADHEIGLWFEINRIHCDHAGIAFHGRGGWGWDWHSNAALSVGYTREERVALADTAVEAFTRRLGRPPRSVAAWYIDAFTLEHFARRHGIVASANCKEQVGTDGYTLWGGLFSGGYYPSRHNALTPARHPEDQVPLPVFRMLGADPIHQYDADVGTGHQQQVLTLEPVYGAAGADPQWVERYLDIIAFAPALGLSYAQAGQENSFGWEKMRGGYVMQLDKIRQRRDAGTLVVETLAQTGEWFARSFAATPAQAQVAATDTMGGHRGAIWYGCRNYRAGLAFEGGRVALRDLHVYHDHYCEPYLNRPCPGRDAVLDALPILDGHRWSGPDAAARGGFRIAAAPDAPEVRVVGPLKVTETSDSQLLVSAPLGNGDQLELHFQVDRIDIRLRAMPTARLELRLQWSRRASAAVRSASADKIDFSHGGVAYALGLASATAALGPGGSLAILADCSQLGLIP